MIKDIYKEYFQKSSAFLYPILGITKKNHIKPLQTYIAWKGLFIPNDYKLVVMYERSKDPKWLKYEKEVLLRNNLLDFCEIIDENTIVYVFDLGAYAKDFENVIKGKYSMLSNEVKKMISDFYGINTPEWVYIESFLFPKKYYKQYSEILGIDIKDLEYIEELCNKPNITKETCILPVPDDFEIK